ncbi:unnamed protein product [Onchocerca flexuosa]|uniref:Ovule protein n=1 Tax=Onchocerca flexuosa TaxID=387005 RepID=A0A183H2Z2_9BILA|nr:unnamed protein product [Onchocerca flexuosa]
MEGSRIQADTSDQWLNKAEIFPSSVLPTCSVLSMISEVCCWCWYRYCVVLVGDLCLYIELYKTLLHPKYPSRTVSLFCNAALSLDRSLQLQSLHSKPTCHASSSNPNFVLSSRQSTISSPCPPHDPKDERRAMLQTVCTHLNKPFIHLSTYPCKPFVIDQSVIVFLCLFQGHLLVITNYYYYHANDNSILPVHACMHACIYLSPYLSKTFCAFDLQFNH